MSSIVSVVLISSDSLFSQGLVHVLRSARYRLVGAARCMAELAAAKEREPEITILVRADDPVGVADEAGDVRAEWKSTRIVVLSGRNEPAACMEALRAGAVACLLKTISKDAFIRSLDLVNRGEIVVSPELLAPSLAVQNDLIVGQTLNPLQQAALLDDAAGRLSPRETEILRCLVAGDSNKHIGRRFAIAETTVKVHVKAILRKINARNRTQAAIWGLSHGIRASNGALPPALDFRSSSAA